ncbi:AtpZ/AtpI family protein [Pseudomonas sp.]|uniref:AtpZ/AtpI family protein n=1 Tax=Pseudomonas sp. TaxID=306 RepID=UPI003D0F476A
MKDEHEALREAARCAAKRAEQAERDPEPSLVRRLAQVGVLGWAIVVPLLLGLLLGRWLDRLLGTGVTFAAALLCLGAALGLWSAWRWMHRQ